MRRPRQQGWSHGRRGRRHFRTRGRQRRWQRSCVVSNTPSFVVAKAVVRRAPYLLHKRRRHPRELFQHFNLSRGAALVSANQLPWRGRNLGRLRRRRRRRGRRSARAVAILRRRSGNVVVKPRLHVQMRAAAPVDRLVVTRGSRDARGPPLVLCVADPTCAEICTSRKAIQFDSVHSTARVFVTHTR